MGVLNASPGVMIFTSGAAIAAFLCIALLLIGSEFRGWTWD